MLKTEVTANWSKNRRDELATELATKITAEYSAEGAEEKSLADADKLGFELNISEVTVDRGNAESIVAANIHSSIFNQSVGGIEQIAAADGDGFVLVRVKSREFPESIDDAAITETGTQVKSAYQNDLMGAYTVDLYETLPVVINNGNIKAVLDQLVSTVEQ